MDHHFPLRVYYEDTDLAGIVYYANYLKFIERGRSEWVRDAGVDQMALKAEHDLVFAVRRVVADYLAPARFGEDLQVLTRLQALGGASMTLTQSVSRDGQLLFTAEVMLVCMSAAGRAVRLPGVVRDKLRAALPAA